MKQERIEETKQDPQCESSRSPNIFLKSHSLLHVSFKTHNLEIDPPSGICKQCHGLPTARCTWLINKRNYLKLHE
jgi:hypothetical protein